MLWIVQDGLCIKLHHPVEYPQLLDLQGLCGHNRAVRYELEGVLLHEGSSMDYGHYFGIHQTSPGVWQRINDADISQSCLEAALSHKDKVYMACYRQLPSRYTALPFAYSLSVSLHAWHEAVLCILYSCDLVESHARLQPETSCTSLSHL